MTAFTVPENLAFDDYTDLVDAISDWMDRTDLTGSAQQMIALAEARMRRRFTPLLLETSTSVTTTNGAVAVPSDFSIISRVMYDGRTLPDYSVSTGPVIPESSEPWAYSLEAGTIRLWPSCDVTLTILYQPKIPQLSETNPTNFILSNFPDAYFFGAMMFAEGYVANDPRASLFKTLWDEAIGEVEVYLTRQRFGGALSPRIAFVP